MPWIRARRVLTSWMAVAAVLMAALAPALSSALGESAGFAICSAAGAKAVPSGPGTGNPSPAPSAHLFEHCPYCSLHAQPGLLPSALSAGVRLLTLDTAVPALAPAVPHARQPWVRARPRAPPQLA